MVGAFQNLTFRLVCAGQPQLVSDLDHVLPPHFRDRHDREEHCLPRLSVLVFRRASVHPRVRQNRVAYRQHGSVAAAVSAARYSVGRNKNLIFLHKSIFWPYLELGSELLIRDVGEIRTFFPRFVERPRDVGLGNSVGGAGHLDGVSLEGDLMIGAVRDDHGSVDLHTDCHDVRGVVQHCRHAAPAIITLL